MSSVVVVLPLVPVTAMNSLGISRQASSTSPSTGSPRSRAAAMTGACAGTPGDLTTARTCSSARRRVVALAAIDPARLLAAGPQDLERGDPRAREPDDEPRAGRQRRAAARIR